MRRFMKGRLMRISTISSSWIKLNPMSSLMMHRQRNHECTELDHQRTRPENLIPARPLHATVEKKYDSYEGSEKVPATAESNNARKLWPSAP